MGPLRTSIALLFLSSVADGATSTLPEVEVAMREALELHAALPLERPELPRLPAAPPPGRGPERPDRALAAGGEARRAAIDHAIEQAAEAAQDALASARERGAAATGRQVDADSDAAVGLGRAAETQGLVPPVPVWPAPGIPPSPAPPVP